jgi:hypothetical protein
MNSVHPVPLIENVGEYGFLESSWFHPKSGNHSMGLHALERGIFIRKQYDYRFADLENRSLLKILFGTDVPNEEEISAYGLNKHFYLAYVSTPMGAAIYLHALLKRWEHEEKGIDICTPDIGCFIRYFEERQGGVALAHPYGVGRVEVLYQGQVYTLKVQERGKTVRLICSGPLSFRDMQKLMHLSGDWVGVRGDQSLTEAISAGKVFFYDGRNHMRYFVKDLIALAENRLREFPAALRMFRMMGQAFLWNLPANESEWVDEQFFQWQERMPWIEIAEKLGSSLQSHEIEAGFRKFGRIVAAEYSFNSFLIHLAERALYHRSHPDVKEEEGRLMHLYMSHQLPFSAVVKNLRQRIVQ